MEKKKIESKHQNTKSHQISDQIKNFDLTMKSRFETSTNAKS
jgi:hypothetical protein